MLYAIKYECGVEQATLTSLNRSCPCNASSKIDRLDAAEDLPIVVRLSSRGKRGWLSVLASDHMVTMVPLLALVIHATWRGSDRVPNVQNGLGILLYSCGRSLVM